MKLVDNLQMKSSPTAEGTTRTVIDTDGNIYQGGTQVTATAAELNAYAITVYMADANTAGSIFVVAPHAGHIIGMYATNYVANTTTKTVLTAEIAGVLVTAPAWEIAVTQAAGDASSSVPTAANAVTAGQVIEIVSDGAGAPVMPMMVTLLISR